MTTEAPLPAADQPATCRPNGAVPAFAFLLGLLDLLGGLLFIGLAGLVASPSGLAFSLTVGGFSLLVAAHLLTMGWGLGRPDPQVYYDHLLTWTMGIGLLTLLSVYLLLPVLIGFVAAMCHPDLRVWFRLGPLPGGWWRLPAGYGLATSILVSLGGYLLLSRTFPISGTSLGLFGPLLSGYGSVVWFLAAVLVLALGARLPRTAWFALPPLLLYPLATFGQGGLIPAMLLLVAWSGGGMRGPARIGSWTGGLTLVTLGMLFTSVVWAVLPIGICPRHGKSLHLYPRWQTPHRKIVHARDVAYAPPPTAYDVRTQGECPLCELAVLHREERSACRQNRRLFAARLQSLAPEIGTGFPQVSVEPGSGGFRLSAPLPGREAAIASWLPLLPLPCPFEQAMATQAAAIRCLSEISFVWDPDEKRIEGHCVWCEANGL